MSERAVEALGESSREAAMPALLQALNDSDSSVRCSAASALGKLDTEVAVPALLQLLTDEKRGVR
jgi:HEAT repeat protein